MLSARSARPAEGRPGALVLLRHGESTANAAGRFAGRWDVGLTDPTRITRAGEEHLATAALIKPNQIGSVSETFDALAAARTVGFAAMISHRSGETPDAFVADLATGSGVGQLKSGAPARGERVAKYNRLLTIAAAHPDLPYGLAPRQP